MSAIDELRAALLDAFTLLPPDRLDLLRPETKAIIDRAALASAESGDEGLRCALHVHVAGQPDDIDRCAECEHDLRATCHVRAAALPQPA